MQLTPKTHSNQNRLDVLLALAIAHGKRNAVGGIENESAFEQKETEKAVALLSALNENDLNALRTRAADYEKLGSEEQLVWQAQSLNRIPNRIVLLDKDVHNTQIAEALRGEPEYLQIFILQNLPRETAENAAPLLGVSFASGGAKTAVNPNLENLLRRRFLANFVSRECLPEQTPLAHLSGEQVLLLVQQLGQSEIALVCRGIKEIENLAPFLRQFGDYDAHAIVELMANIKTADGKRIVQAENLVQEAWHREPEAVLVTQLVGIWKLAAAISEIDDSYVRYTAQKLPLNLAEKLSARLAETREQSGETQLPIRIFADETETTAGQILLESRQENQPPKDEIMQNSGELKV